MDTAGGGLTAALSGPTIHSRMTSPNMKNNTREGLFLRLVVSHGRRTHGRPAHRGAQAPARSAGGAKPPAPRAAVALARSQAYQDAAEAPSILKAYAADLAHYKAWCDRHGFVAMPAIPEVVGAYLAAAGEGYAMPSLRRRVAAIARACGVAGHPLDGKHPAIRETLRGIGRKHVSAPDENSPKVPIENSPGGLT